MTDTIAAIATAIGPCGIAIVRISGGRAIPIAEFLFDRPVSSFESHTVHYGKLKNPATGDHIDDVLLTVFRAPRSYTGEDTVEISCHGGIEIVREALSAAYATGARPAEPGEFTKRAFLNGRLDLAQAEAVNDLIKARTEDSRRLALRQLEGDLSREVKSLLDRVTGLLASVEASIDFPEDVEEPDYHEMKVQIEGLISRLDELIESSSRGRVYREGIRMIIAGRPNVGKSSILNALLRESRAIVTPVPGTTRDVIEETVNILGIPVVAVDTAGLRETQDIVERMGVELTEKSLAAADLILAVIDASFPVLIYLYRFIYIYQYQFEKGGFLWIGSSLSHMFQIRWPIGGGYPVFLTARNLFEPDLILVALYLVSMFISQRLTVTPDPAQAEQQKMMAYMFPIMFGVIFATFPSAFILYWLLQNILQTAHQYLYLRGGDQTPTAAGATSTGASTAPAAPTDQRIERRQSQQRARSRRRRR